jgi:hypothetical protein
MTATLLVAPDPARAPHRHRCQVRTWDGDHDDRLSDREIDVFRKAGEGIPGGPDCGRSERPRQ